MHDNDVAGRKLVSQEEDWRLQNQTLLEELQKLVIRYLIAQLNFFAFGFLFVVNGQI